MPGALAVGLFVGGRGSRFGGVAKGNLRAPSGERLVERLEGICRTALPGAPVFLVGERAEYAGLGHETLADVPAGIGPLGGLRALVLRAAEARHDGVLALACDLPFVTTELVHRLATEAEDADALAPREDGLWYPLTARYSVRTLDAIDAALMAREHSLQKLFARLGSAARRLDVDAEELASLRDWDSPDDLAR
jgi:molybdopterin-guanine dinucleotide biosynthesis protein A